MKIINSTDLASKISKNENHKQKDVKEVTDSIFKFVAETMKSGDRDNYEYENVRIHNFGIFGVKKGRINWYKRKDEYNKNKNEVT